MNTKMMTMKKNKKKTEPRYYYALDSDFFKRTMGEKRFSNILKEVKKKHGTDKVVFDYTDKGPKMRLHDPFGKLLGTIAEVEEWADKQRNKRKKK